MRAEPGSPKTGRTGGGNPRPGGIVALAAGAHPDDIEFMMAGTLLLLREAGAEIHMWNLSRGDCGSNTLDADEISALRWMEARESAALAGAVIHPPIASDIGILYERELIEKTAAVIRTVKPNIMLVPSPRDYMEDHQTACRLLVTGAFTRNMRNFRTDPPVPPCDEPVAIYHAMPHGLRDGMRRLVRPELYIDTSGVIETKRRMLEKHSSQKEWLDETQHVGAYLELMESMSRDVGAMSGRFIHAEGWRRHGHLGFAEESYDPLPEMLSEHCRKDPGYGETLGKI